MKIAILEDDTFIANEISVWFSNKNSRVVCFKNANELLDFGSLASFDIFLLDINMPKKSGIEVLKQMREFGIKTPAIFVTSMSDIDYVKDAFKAGCSDYIRKPFYFEELELRIAKLLDLPKEKAYKLSKYHTFYIDSLELKEGKNIVDLSDNERRLIYILVKNAGHFISSEFLIDYIWEDKNVESNTLRTQIRKLRQRLKDNFIINSRGHGYKIEVL